MYVVYVMYVLYVLYQPLVCVRVCVGVCVSGLGWRIHESVEDTKLSTNKQHTLSLAFVCIICMYSKYIMCIYSMYVFDTYAPTHNVYMCPVCPGFGFTGAGFRPFDDVRFVQGSSMTKYVEGLGLYRV